MTNFEVRYYLVVTDSCIFFVWRWRHVILSYWYHPHCLAYSTSFACLCCSTTALRPRHSGTFLTLETLNQKPWNQKQNFKQNVIDKKSNASHQQKYTRDISLRLEKCLRPLYMPTGSLLNKMAVGHVTGSTRFPALASSAGSFDNEAITTLMFLCVTNYWGLHLLWICAILLLDWSNYPLSGSHFKNYILFRVPKWDKEPL